jgi:phenylacetate-coenzyme A ligase PaaK-like adenylate-forming protein
MLGAAALEFQSAARLEQWQAKRLVALVQHAYLHVPYYRETWRADDVASVRNASGLARLPVLEPATLRDLSADRLLTEGVDPAACFPTRTSGSTGTPRTVYCSVADLHVIRGRYVWDMMMVGFRPWDRLAYLRFAAMRHHRFERLGLLPSFHVDSTKPLPEQAAEFVAARPTSLVAFPHVTLSVVEELERQGVRYRGIRLVLFGGERTSPAVRRYILGQLGARGCEMYAATEANVIARSCRRGALHLRTSDVVVEVEHDDGAVSVADGTGAIIVTPLQAKAMPLVRYRLGDRVEIGPDDCGCGRSRRPILHSVLGRVDDRVLDRSGREVNAQQVVTAVEGVAGIRRLQLHQYAPGRIDIHAVIAAEAPADVAEQIERAARRVAGQFDVTVRIVDDVDREPSGKIRLVHRHDSQALGSVASSAV